MALLTLEDWLSEEHDINDFSILFGWYDDDTCRWNVTVLDDGTAVTWCEDE